MENGTPFGSLDGKMEYLDGKQGNASLDFVKDGETWKARSSSLEE